MAHHHRPKKASPAYPAHLLPLLTLGDPRGPNADRPDRRENWLDYRTLGVAESDVPDLVRMVRDNALRFAPEPECWTALHAWRALACLRARDAVAPLIEALDTLAKGDDEWALEEIPEVLAAIGPAALPELKRFVPDQRRNMWARLGVASAMTKIAQADPSRREEVVNAFVAQLELAEYNDPIVNGSIVAELVDLKAVEAAEAINRAFEAGLVDEFSCGSLTDVLKEMGMLVGDVPIPAGMAGDDKAIGEVIAEYEAKLKLEPKTPGPISAAEHERALREIGEMLEARSAGRRPIVGDATESPR
jgi:hypothetical protein